MDTEDQLRWMERTAKDKGLAEAFVRIGRRVFIDPAKFHQLVRQSTSSDETPISRGTESSFRLPSTVCCVLEREARRVRLDPEDLIIEALRFAPWFQDALERELPVAEIEALMCDNRRRQRGEQLR